VCGICGKLNFDPRATVSPALLKGMADTIEHRGPDDQGYYVSGPVGLGFRRLSIIDLNTGHQPISNEDGTVWIVFNGEIYNYQELRQFLQSKGHVFRSQTDTEVIVHLYEEFGEACVDRLRGMFGFAIWDENHQTLLLARDRVGIKPLYYRLTKDSLIFGSEIKTILADPEVAPEVRPQMVDRFLSFYYVPGEDTLFRDILKLAPGCTMLVKNGRAKIRQYWDLQFAPAEQNFEDATQELNHLLEECLQQHMISDVPVGFLLSGGVDSTAMLGYAVGKTEQKLRSFTLGFSDPAVVDERPYARLAAKRYGSEHHEMTISAQEFADFLPKYSWHMEEPVCEPTAIALYYVARLAKDFVKVLISGEGGDEAFAGYPNYRNMLWVERLKKAAGPLSGGIASVLSLLNRVAPSGRLVKYAGLLRTPFDRYYYSRISGPGTFFNQQAAELYSGDFAGLISKDVSIEPATRYLTKSAGYGVVNRMLYLDTKTALPDDLLLKADKMTMANSIELRVPLLDHKLLEFAARLPENFKVKGFTTKHIAKAALRSRVPKEILNRKKVGFPVPYGVWLNTELKDMVHDVLLDRKTVARGYFNRNSVEKLIKNHSISTGYSKEILSLVSLELWHRAFVPDRAAATVPTASVAEAGIAVQ
jgi:asparagine synthase (glutamine-hydrolysing)